MNRDLPRSHRLFGHRLSSHMLLGHGLFGHRRSSHRLLGQRLFGHGLLGHGLLGQRLFGQRLLGERLLGHIQLGYAAGKDTSDKFCTRTVVRYAESSCNCVMSHVQQLFISHSTILSCFIIVADHKISCTKKRKQNFLYLAGIFKA